MTGASIFPIQMITSAPMESSSAKTTVCRSEKTRFNQSVMMFIVWSGPWAVPGARLAQSGDTTL